MRGAEENVKIRAVAFSQRLVSPRVGWDRHDEKSMCGATIARGVDPASWLLGSPGPFGALKILRVEFLILRDRLCKRHRHAPARARRLVTKFQYHRVFVIAEPFAIQIVMLIEHVDEAFQVVAHQQ